MMAVVDRATLASYLDHTLLRPEATPAEVADLCAEAGELGVAAVCIAPSLLPLPAGSLRPGIAVAAVCGFPTGAHVPEVKATEARRAVIDGATEVDVVLDLGAARAGDWRTVEAGLQQVRDVLPGSVVMKVIIESAVLDRDSIIAACRAADAAGADFVKTSTGFHPAGGATVEAVALMAGTVGGRLGVKASGGIRTTEAALAMIDAGATRLGCSASRIILDGLL
jgi:deoxyribose-phosphate aldolase